MTPQRLKLLRAHFESTSHEAHPACPYPEAAIELLNYIDVIQHSRTALHRRAQKAEAELLKRPPDTWKSPERRVEADERDGMMAAVDKANLRCRGERP